MGWEWGIWGYVPYVCSHFNDILKKLPLIGYDLGEFSLDTVKMFHDDAKAAQYKI